MRCPGIRTLFSRGCDDEDELKDGRGSSKKQFRDGNGGRGREGGVLSRACAVRSACVGGQEVKVSREPVRARPLAVLSRC